MKRLIIHEPVEFSDDSYTERGERVYKTMEFTLTYPGKNPIVRVVNCPKGIGITEEYIEDTIQGCLKALALDYPDDVYEVIRNAPNRILFNYVGFRGIVQ